MHPFVRKDLAIPPEFADRLVDGTRTKMDVNDLLFVVDLRDHRLHARSCSSSRSSTGRCCSSPTTSRSTSTGRDLYVPFEEFVPGRIVRTFPELLDAIRREDYEFEKVAEFARTHFAHLDGGSTDRVIDLAIGR